ncbi:MAG TPA: hypothetical protein VFX49_20560 [Chloroflexota bacterium]|nr:hypothetical protein [Chloroflexota bacterium]
MLNQLGVEGWELTGVSNTHSTLIYRMLLTRRASRAATGPPRQHP